MCGYAINLKPWKKECKGNRNDDIDKIGKKMDQVETAKRNESIELNYYRSTSYS